MRTSVIMTMLSMCVLSCGITEHSLAMPDNEGVAAKLVEKAKAGDVTSTLQLRQAAFDSMEIAKILIEALKNNEIAPLETIITDTTNVTEESIQMLHMLAAEYDDEEAENVLIKLARNGHTSALKLFIDAAKTGNSQSLNVLWDAAKIGNQEALLIIIDLAKQENSNAMYKLADIAKTGNNFALTTIIEIAKNGNTDAIGILSNLVKFTNNDEATTAFMELIASNNDKAIAAMSQMVTANNENALNYIKSSIKNDSAYRAHLINVLTNTAKCGNTNAMNLIIELANDNNKQAISSLYKIIRFEEFRSEKNNTQRALNTLIDLTKNGNMDAWGYVADIADFHSDPELMNTAKPFKARPRSK